MINIAIEQTKITRLTNRKNKTKTTTEKDKKEQQINKHFKGQIKVRFN